MHNRVVTRVLASSFLIVAFCFVGAQSQPQSDLKTPRRTPPSTVSAAAPVTRDEVKKSFNRLENAVKTVVPKYAPGAPLNLAGDQNATREQVILQMDRIFQGAKPAFRFSPRKVEYDAKLITVRDPAAKRALENLIAWGFVGKVTPLATSKNPGLGLKDFGDSMGFFLARLAELTHTPSSKFSPYLQRDGGGGL